jgi:DNA polymerase-1
MNPMKRLFLLDGMALVYRAHFALIQNPIRNSKGVNTSAMHGFVQTLLAILEKERPTHIGVAFDTSAPTARHVRYPAYKAQRDAMPEELAAAIPQVKALCRAFRIPVIELDGYEADDLIGTLVRRAETEGFESYMVTPDKDFAQLLSPHTFMWKPGRKGDEHDIITLERLADIWGVSNPHQITDLLGLMGDASDNIPGIPGIGPKTAQKLIAEFGSVEQLIVRTESLKGRQRELVETHTDEAFLSKELATIVTDAPVQVTWDDLVLEPRDDEALRALFDEFEFRTLARRVFGTAAAPTDRIVRTSDTEAEDSSAATTSLRTIHDIDHTYSIADTPERVQHLVAELMQQPAFCFDIETTSLDRFEAKLLGIAFCWQPHQAWYLPITQLDPLRPLLEAVFSSAAEKIGHNLKYDLCVLSRHGIEVAGPFFDTMLVHTLAAPERRHSMDHLAESLLGYRTIRLQDIASGKPNDDTAADDLFAFASDRKPSKELDMASIPTEVLAEYAAEDADITFQLAGILRSELATSAQETVHCTIEAPLLPVLVRMEMEGIRIDTDALAGIGAELQQQIDQLAASIHHHAGRPINIASPKQLGELLFDQLGLADKAKKTKTGQYRTDETTLASLEGRHPVIADILAWREATKLKSTYLDALPKSIVPATGRVHTHFHQLVAATGRLASSDPNLQNIPVRSEAGRRIRKAFVPREGYTLLACDYSQIELRIMAALANDATLIDAFRHGADIHTVTAAKVFGADPAEVSADQRRTAKMVNFGIIYGISAFGLSQRLGIPRANAAAIIDAYFREYPAVRTFMEQTVVLAKQNGYVETLAGRRRLLPDLQSANQNLRGNAERAAINTPIQGTAADMIKLAMIRIDSLLRSVGARTRMLLQVHDELVFDLAHGEESLIPQILEAMTTALPLPHSVPVEVEHGTGPDWLAAH